MKLLTMILMLTVVATGAMAQRTVDYDWETGGTILGQYLDMTCTIVDNTGGNYVHGGTYALRCEDATASGTPQSYVAFVWGLQDGDEVTGSFYRYDDTAGVAPSCRIYGHWNDSLPGDPAGYDGSASGQDDYGPGTGWDQATYTWTVADGLHRPGDRGPHVLRFRRCGVDRRSTDHRPGTPCWIQTPGFIVEPDGTTVASEMTAFGGVKALYR